ncbi:hypothetical protein [Vagococcus hydrophili]|uniref:Uncharacterized protein n=1 Tax=Vagococcus hydrophili TaxID=2714947 RepID=A0A6G8AQ48_9ENTE|nr:hypothetical protein [Vagococcus hydrophili]QIL47062.1 hypothetical protein G7082_00215 [Vagococcus hydrophili]
MNLERVESFTDEIAILKVELQNYEKQKSVLNDLYFIDVHGGKLANHKEFRIQEDRGLFRLDEVSVEVFKTLALKELEQKITETEKQLKDLIKKGIMDND